MNSKKHEYLLEYLMEAREIERKETERVMREQREKRRKWWASLRGKLRDLYRWPFTEANSSDNSTIV